MRTIKVFNGSAALGAITFLGALLLAPAVEAEPQAARSRSSASASAPQASSAGSGSSASRAAGSSSVSSRSRGSSRGAAVTRSAGRHSAPGSRTVVRGTSRHRSSSGGHGHGYRPYFGRPYYYGGYAPYPPYWGLSFGLGWWGGYYYSPHFGYYAPYYGPSYPYAGRPYYKARVYAEPIGAFDLNVKPKKTEVWVDGLYVGTVGRFDGFPDYLWLDEGEHQLVFYLEGYVTVERRVETLAGVVADLRIDMEKGPSTPPREVAAARPPAAPAPRYRQPPPPAVEPERERAEAEAPPPSDAGSLDLRQAPGRLVLSVEPADASVYLDGRYLGTGRDLARLHAGLLIDSGTHRLQVVRPGFADREVEFTVAAGEEERIEIGLGAEESAGSTSGSG